MSRLKYNLRKKKRVKDFGSNNRIHINEKINIKHLSVEVYGNNNEVIIDTKEVFYGNIFVGTRDCPCSNCKVTISKGTSSNGIMIRLLEDNSIFRCGEDCMFSNNIQFWGSDTHTMTDFKGNIINLGNEINIGNHVWIGTSVHIGKNTFVPNGCVIGMGSVVCGRFIEENTVIAGNPAKMVKKNIKWNRARPNNYNKSSCLNIDKI